MKKYILHTVFFFTALAFTLFSCVEEPLDYPDGEGQGLPVTITVAASDTRSGATIAGDDMDYEIEKLRVMGFRKRDGSLAFNEPVVFTESGTAENKVTEGIIHVLTGSFTVIFIANEQLDASLSTQLGAMQPDVAVLSDLEQLSFRLSALEWKSGNSNLVPMAEICEGVIITGDNKLSFDGSNINGVWKVPLTRLAVRIDLTLTITDAQQDGFDAMANDATEDYFIDFLNVPQQLFILSGTDNSTPVANLRFEAKWDDDSYSTTPGSIQAGSDPEVYATVTYPRLLLPEACFTPKEDKDKAVVLAAYLSDESNPSTGRIGYNIPDDYTLPRNLYYEIKAGIEDNTPTELEMQIAVKGWEIGEVDDMYGDRHLRVSAITASVNERNRIRIFFWSDQQKVKIDEETGGGVEVDQLFYGLTGTTPENFQYDYNTTTGEGSGYFDLITDHGKTLFGSDTHRIYLNAGGLKREITVKMTASPMDPAAYQKYVGAFWRNDQKGERVIMMPGNGDWTATVAVGTTWIRLEKGRSLDPALWTETPDDSENFPVENGSTSISGTGTAYFRIGLTGYNPSGENRYGRISFTTGGITYPIYIRQGEEPDYLMNPTDGSGNNAVASRPNAKKYSPYNLTSPEYLSGTKTGGTNLNGHSQLDIQGGVFTEYPTQAGAYFQWTSETYPRYAWHPAFVEGTMPWSTNISYSYWDGIDKMRNSHETCPVGYRRPNDGVIAGAEQGIASTNILTNSEQRQSLWYNPVVNIASGNTNILWGYYADGFFDRHEISTPAGESRENSAVCTTGHQVGYAGGLFYNPLDNKSLFFPAAGFRSNDAGLLRNAGHYASYWTASGQSDSERWFLNLYLTDALDIYAAQNYAERAFGYPIRCVVGNWINEDDDPNSLPNRFAKSNIVKMADGTLKFATNQAENDQIPANSQGLYFRFGSLIGINMDIEFPEDYGHYYWLQHNVNNTVFWPQEYDPPLSWSWSWINIPFYDGNLGGDDEFIQAYPSTNGYDAESGLGDICRYISDREWVEGKWRMPTATELAGLAAYQQIKTNNMSLTRDVVSTPGTYGTGTIDVGIWAGENNEIRLHNPYPTSIFFPATGYMIGTGIDGRDGSVFIGPTNGYYWSSTVQKDPKRHYSLYMNADGKLATVTTNGKLATVTINRPRAHSVRCIKEMTP